MKEIFSIFDMGFGVSFIKVYKVFIIFIGHFFIVKDIVFLGKSKSSVFIGFFGDIGEYFFSFFFSLFIGGDDIFMKFFFFLFNKFLEGCSGLFHKEDVQFRVELIFLVSCYARNGTLLLEFISAYFNNTFF